MNWKIVRLQGNQVVEVGSVVIDNGQARVITNDPKLADLHTAFVDGLELDVIEGDGRGAVLDVRVGPEDPRYAKALREILPFGGYSIRS